MTIETPRLILRPHTPDDIELLAPILSDPVTMRFWPTPFTPENVEGWVARSIASHAEHGFGRKAIILRETGEMIGDCGLMRSMVDGAMRNDIGYILHHPYWGKGYATEAARAVMADGFERLGLETMHANMAHDNLPSSRVAERLGMRRVGEFLNERNRGILTWLYVREKNGTGAGDCAHNHVTFP